jgi:hypothetical protein
VHLKVAIVQQSKADWNLKMSFSALVLTTASRAPDLCRMISSIPAAVGCKSKHHAKQMNFNVILTSYVNMGLSF